jgi:PAS domain S-box-containing protein
MAKKYTYEELEKRVSELEQAESRCSNAEKKFDTIFNASPVMVGLSDLETGEFVEANQAFYVTLCLSPDEVIGKKSTDIIHLDETFRTITIAKLKKDGFLRNAETVIYTKKNEKINVLLSAEILEVNNRKNILTAAIDISRLKRFEELQKFQGNLAVEMSSKTTLEELLRVILTNIFKLTEYDSGGVYLFKKETGTLDSRFSIGLSEKLIKNSRRYDLNDIRTQMVMKGDLIYLPTSEAPETIKKDLEMDNIISIVVVPVKFGGDVIGSITLGSHTHEHISDLSKDILESISKINVGGAILRVLAEESVRKSEEKYRDIFENLLDVYFKTAIDGTIEVVSPSAEAISGYQISELIGRNADILYQDPQDRQGLLNALNKKGQVRAFELTLKKKTGEPYYVSVNADLIYNKEGVPLGMSGTIRDITEIKQAEKEKLLAQKIAAEQEKHALVGQIAGQIAHDFNNILGIIMGNTELSLLECNDEETKKTLEIILEQTIRGRNLTKNLVTFAKDQEPKLECFRISQKIDLVIDLLKKDLHGIGIIKDEKAGMLELLADPGMIEHMLVNLLQNSIHALSKATDPKIVIRTYESDNNLYIEIEDNGCGIPPEHIKKIYNPAFTLKGGRDITGSYKKDIKGTGYGMANVKKYIEQHNGIISVESKLGCGTKFIIEIPIISKELTNGERTRICDEVSHFEKRILLVEDEQSLSDVQYRLLTNELCRHIVDIASTGQIAIDLIDRNEYDFLSLDYVLPGEITGRDVYNHIREKSKKIPILFISGNIEFLESIRELKKNDPHVDHLSKPCKNVDYLSAINRLMSRVEK